MVDYVAEFKSELGEVEKLIDTPEFMRKHALGVLRGILKQQIPHSSKRIVDNGIQTLINIQDSSIKNNYEVIYSQSCVLAVSILSAKIEKYFINYGNTNWDKVDVTKKAKELKFSLGELAEYGFNLRPLIMTSIKGKDSAISFQDLLSTKRTFEEYFHKEISLNENVEKQIIFYQHCRHNIVHLASVVDENFLSRVDKKDANIKNYKVGDEIKLNGTDWKQIKASFTELISTLVQPSSAELSESA